MLLILVLVQALLLFPAFFSCDGQTVTSNCSTTGEIRLAGGSNKREGRVEVCLNNTWGTVCDDLWDSRDAIVVCRQLGLPNVTSAIALSRAYFGEGSGPVHLDDIECVGSESSLSQCPRLGLAPNCLHSEDASVICLSTVCADGDVRLAGSDRNNQGRVEICFNNQYGTVCDDGWDNVDASVVCGQLGFQRAGAISVNRAQLFGPGVGMIYFDDVDCTGSEEALNDCQHVGVGVSNCNHNEDAGVICKLNTAPVVCNDTDVRLRDGRTPNEGRVEICYYDNWGTICDDNWDDNDARVVCRQLGYSANGSVYLREAAFGQGEGLIFRDEVECTGSENTLDECQANDLGVHNCGHREDASVVCQPSSMERLCEEGQVRLVDGPDGRDYEGRLEICVLNQWGTVCDDRYNVEEATVVCRQLGFTNGKALPLPNAFFGEGAGIIWLDELGCVGNESSLLDCTHSGVGQTNCRHSSDVSIICPLPEGVPKVCENGAFRLVDGSTSNEGRVELCFNGYWGTVCDDAWDQRDAAVVCRQLGFLSSNTTTALAAIGALYGQGEGPILLDDVGCEGDEVSLLACSAQELGTNNCNHGEDAGVLCPAENGSRQCSDGEIRLVGGSRLGEGRVQMCFNGAWGSVCSSGFGEQEAQVTCRSLGFNIETMRSIPIVSGSFGPVVSPIILNGLSCVGSEETFLECPRTTMALQASCGFVGEAAAVICTERPCTDGTIRLVGGDGTANGRVEVCVAGTWGTVCASSVNDDIASQICTSLGHQGTSFTQVPGSLFEDSTLPTFSASSDAQGLKYTRQPSCGGEGTVGLFCVATGQDQRCKPGGIRLADGSGPFEGRVEVCFNNVWGTVCDDSWDDRAAAVVCRQLGQPTEGAYAEGTGKYGPGVGPIYLDDVKCSGSESHILECPQLPLSAGHNCDHTEDATAVCPGGAMITTSETTPPSTTAVPSVSVEGLTRVGPTSVAIIVLAIVIFLLMLIIVVAIAFIVYKTRKPSRLLFRSSSPSDQQPIVNESAYSEEPTKEDIEMS